MAQNPHTLGPISTCRTCQARLAVLALPDMDELAAMSDKEFDDLIAGIDDTLESLQ